jgi:tetratricopeptide (TPR) repeat protein
LCRFGLKCSGDISVASTGIQELKHRILLLVIASLALLANAPARAEDHNATFANLYWGAQAAKDRSDYARAEKDYLLAVKEAEHFPPNDCRLVRTLEDLADVYELQGLPQSAVPLRERIVAIYQKQFGDHYPRVAIAMVKVALCYRTQGNSVQAETYYKKALASYEGTYGADHVRVAEILGDLGQLYILQGEYDKAEPCYRRALAICAKTPADDKLRQYLSDELACILEFHGKPAEAKKLLSP